MGHHKFGYELGPIVLNHTKKWGLGLHGSWNCQWCAFYLRVGPLEFKVLKAA